MIWEPGQNLAEGTKPKTVAVFVPASQIFPGIEVSVASLKDLLHGVSRTDALIAAARLNLILANPENLDHHGKQNYCINAFLSAIETDRINLFLEEHPTSHTFVFFRPQLLDLMLWVCRYSTESPGDGTTLRDPVVRTRFAQAALIAGELWGQRVFDGRMVPTDDLGDLRRRSLGAVRMSAAMASSGMSPMTAVGRGQRLFLEHFAHVRPELEGAFRARTGLNLEEYLAVTTSIAFKHLGRTPSNVRGADASNGLMNIAQLDGENSRLEGAFATYCNAFALTPDELANALWPKRNEEADPVPADLTWEKIKILRQFPMLKTQDGRAIVLDSVMFAESACVGPLFAILPSGRDECRQAFAAFGKAFEAYALSILSDMYPSHGELLPSRLIRNPIGIGKGGQPVEIADACLLYPEEVVMFEAKAVWLPDDAAEHTDPEIYAELVQKRYVRDTNGNSGAVGQSASNITKLTTGEWIFNGIDWRSVRRIYPILLSHDSNLNAPLHCHFLAKAFHSELDPDETSANGYFRKNDVWIAPLTVLTISDLEILQRSVERFSLVEALSEYVTWSPDRISSFHDFLSSTRFRHHLLASGYLADGVLAALSNLKQMMG